MSWSPADAAHLVWAVNLGVIDFNPWPVRRADLDRPDELRVDLDPGPGVPFADVRAVALVVGGVLEEHGLRGWPKTSGSRGIHINVRIEPRWGFDRVRRAALALAREAERREPARATSRWWKEERHGVFIDYNQNARDRTVASAYSVRAVPDARVSCPLTWDEVADVEPAELRIDTVPARLDSVGDPAAGIDEAAGSLDGLLALADRDEEEGLGDAPWPPHFRKQPGESPRVAPSRPGARRRNRRADPAEVPRSGVELIERAARRVAVGAEAQQAGAVADAPAARVVVAHLGHQLGPQLHPLQVAVGVPSAGVAASAPAGLVRGELRAQRPLARGGEARAVAHRPQRLALVEAEDQRADRVLDLPRPPSHDHAVEGAHPLDLGHALALAGPVGGVEALGDDALGGGEPLARPVGVGAGLHRIEAARVLLEPGAALGERRLEQ